jgi:hypothetical protein
MSLTIPFWLVYIILIASTTFLGYVFWGGPSRNNFGHFAGFIFGALLSITIACYNAGSTLAFGILAAITAVWLTMSVFGKYGH